jgi:hypothetical protein
MLLSDITQRRVVIPYRSFGTAYWSHLQGSRRDFLTLEDGTDMLSRRAGSLRNIREERRYHLHGVGSLKSWVFVACFTKVCYRKHNSWLAYSLIDMLTSRCHLNPQWNNTDISVCDYKLTVLPMQSCLQLRYKANRCTFTEEIRKKCVRNSDQNTNVTVLVHRFWFVFKGIIFVLFYFCKKSLQTLTQYGIFILQVCSI